MGMLRLGCFANVIGLGVLGLLPGCADESFIDENSNEIDDRFEDGWQEAVAEARQRLSVGGGRVSGLYCGDGLNGHATGTLYRYARIDASRGTWSVERVCPNAKCGVNAAGTNDACIASPTALENSIVNNALAARGNSPASLMTGDAARGGATWLTDASGGDGAAMRLSIQRYHNWPGSRDAQGRPSRQRPPAATLDSMKAALANYNATDRTSITDRIIAVYNGSVPATDQATLTYLGVRAQCKEWADRTVQTSGGTSRSYATYNTRQVARLSDYTAGKGVTWNNDRHIGIVTRVNRDAIGRLLSIEVTEANWGPGFSNPSGQLPWARTVGTRTIPAGSLGAYRVFSF